MRRVVSVCVCVRMCVWGSDRQGGCFSVSVAVAGVFVGLITVTTITITLLIICGLYLYVVVLGELVQQSTATLFTRRARLAEVG